MPNALPGALKPFAAEIASTVLPFAGATVERYAPASNRSSQLGGLPWWPPGKPYPRDAAGLPLYLLVQVDCRELASLVQFPRTGLLQVFIGGGEFYGCNLDDLTSPTGFACIYHEHPEGPGITAFEVAEPETGYYLPLEDPLRARALTLAPATMTVDACDYRMPKLLRGIAADDDIMELYHEFAAADVPAIRFGGYPTFTQTDPREHAETDRYGDVTLLTVDTTDAIMWGDSGVAQFFARSADLGRRDFSRIAYNWDCC